MPEVLVIIPTTKIKYDFGFSTPLSWLFSNHADKIHGIYGFQMNPDYVLSFDTFIIELNWYIELYEFTLLVEFIKKHNKKAKILFGGLFSALKYKEIFNRYNVDYYIKGDNELPLKLFLDGENPNNIPNFVGRDFENPVSYIFRAEDYKDIEFNLDWFSNFFKELEKDSYLKEKSFGYALPMVVTSKGGCPVAHDGCEYCMGSHFDVMENIYGRKPVVMDNNDLILLIKKLEKGFDNYSIIVTSEYIYDFSGERFEYSPWIEIDSPVTPENVENMFKAFKSCKLLLPIYKEGVMGHNIVDYKEFLRFEDEKHLIMFPIYNEDSELIKTIPKKNLLPDLHELFAPDWAHWHVYNDFELALKNSRTIYNFFIKKGYRVFTFPADEVS